jgi:tRNA A37 threonylcarbamoyltransferase TsaD
MIQFLISYVCVYFAAIATAFCVDNAMMIVDHNLKMSEKFGDVDQLAVEVENEINK